jgi:hypothetical protein
MPLTSAVDVEATSAAGDPNVTEHCGCFAGIPPPLHPATTIATSIIVFMI